VDSADLVGGEVMVGANGEPLSLNWGSFLKYGFLDSSTGGAGTTGAGGGLLIGAGLSSRSVEGVGIGGMDGGAGGEETLLGRT
jgi:hypothetical protein